MGLGDLAVPTKTGQFNIIILAGLSGAGKSSVINVFEDMRYFAIDGLPFGLLPQILPFLNAEALAHHQGLIIGADFSQYTNAKAILWSYKELTERFPGMKLLFVNASKEAITRRYATTRRPHPLESEQMGLELAINQESKRMAPLMEAADAVLETSEYTIHDLRRFLQARFFTPQEQSLKFKVNLISFGFKYEIPADTDIMFDLRFLPNPYFDEKLRHLSGKEEKISHYVLADKPGSEFLEKLNTFLAYLLPLYEQEGRYRVSIALGCTGGRHRSVAVTEAVAKALSRAGYNTIIEHRHIDMG